MGLATTISTILIFAIFAALAFGVTVGQAAIPTIIPNIQISGDPEHDINVQEAKCELQADDVYRTADKDDSVLPSYVERCMTVSGYDFVGQTNAVCYQNDMDALKTGQTGLLGGYSMYQDISCYQKHRVSLFGS